MAFTLPGREASVLISVSVSPIIDTAPELKQMAKTPGKPGFQRRFATLTPV